MAGSGMKQFCLFDLFDKPVNVEREVESRRESGIKLRPYQVESVDRVYQEWQTERSTLVCLPTGTGKSVVFSEVMRRWIDSNA